MVRLTLRGLVILGAAIGVTACSGPGALGARPCMLAVYAGSTVVAAESTSTTEGPCNNAVYLDSVGTDTTVTPNKVLYTIDSVVTDTTD